jgi:uncharacterized protein
MSVTAITLAKNNTLPQSQDYEFLRSEGIKHIANLASRLWTDYNVHDPGITILEALCYAITDLGYRTSFDVKDILARDPNDTSTPPKYFYTAAEIFPCHPVTIGDYRKLIIDVAGIKNAWFKISSDYEVPVYIECQDSKLIFDKTKGDEILQLQGFYNVLVEFEDDVIIPGNDAKSAELKKKIRSDIADVLYAHRNLCEDFLKISEVQYEDIAVCAEIEVIPGADMEDVLANIYYKLGNYFSPEINFYTIEELLNSGKTTDQVFEGPLLKHGFIDNDELNAAEIRTELRVSDIIHFIMDDERIIAVKSILLTSYINDVVEEADKTWILELHPGDYVARLSPEKARFIVYQDVFPYTPNTDNVISKYKELTHYHRKYKLTGHDADLPVPQGEYKEISDYYPVTNEFPVVYGIGEFGLSDTEPDLRKAQARQMKGYLLFFEQVLADYLAQLNNSRDLFSFDPSVKRTYFTEIVTGIKNIDELYFDYPNLAPDLNTIAEDTPTFLDRRNRFLDHLMGRFAESMADYALMLQSMMTKHDADTRLIKDKIAFLKEYPELSANRGKAFNYKGQTWDTDNVAGMKKRVCRLLGFDSYKRETLSNDLLNISQTGGKWKITLTDPDDNTKIILSSIEYPDEECAESQLEYFMSYGGERTRYKLTGSSGNFSFTLDNACWEAVANGQTFPTAKKRDEGLQKVLDYFNVHCNIENFHLIENILLRPHDTATTLLDICISDDQKNGHDLNPDFSFEVYKDPEKWDSNATWGFTVKDNTGKKITESKNFPGLIACLKAREEYKTYAADPSGYQATGNSFRLLNTDKNKILANSVDLGSANAVSAMTAKMETYFLSLKDKSDKDCGCIPDPYSFRIDVVIPCWPKRFRNMNFRRLVEQTIRMETPAHIFPRVCWVDLMQMRQLEKDYKAWLAELKSKDILNGEIPDKTLVNNLIKTIFNLKNIYPTAKLHGCDAPDTNDPQVVLDHTAIGIL